jgi:hypothetical protein
VALTGIFKVPSSTLLCPALLFDFELEVPTMSRKLTLCFTTMTSLVLASATAMAQDPYAQPAPYGAPPPAGYAAPAPAPYGAPPPAGYAAPAPGYAAPPPGYAAPAPYGAPPAYAAPAYQVPGSHQHDGFFLRLTLGPGYLHNSASYQGQTIKLSGVGGTFGVAAGGVISPNLVIYGEAIGTTVTDPSYDEGSGSVTANDTTLSTVGIGPGIAYYLDGNAYLSATLALTKMSWSYDSYGYSTSYDTDWGFGGSLSGGKEWWVSDNWGLGVAGQLMLASMKDQEVDARWTSIAVSVLFSATYN